MNFKNIIAQRSHKYVYEDKIYIIPTIEYRSRTINDSTIFGIRFRFWHWWYNISIIIEK